MQAEQNVTESTGQAGSKHGKSVGSNKVGNDQATIKEELEFRPQISTYFSVFFSDVTWSKLFTVMSEQIKI